MNLSQGHELLGLIKTLTWRKAYNVGQIISSYIAARVVKKPIHWGMPVSLGIEPTTACNLRCSQCISGLRAFTRPTGRLRYQDFCKLIDEVHPTLIYLIMYFQGEPYLNPDFLKMVKYAHQRNIYVMTSTNAHFLDKETAFETVSSGLSKIIISLDGLNQATYEAYRTGGNLQTVISGLKNLIQAKKTLNSNSPFIELQFIVFEHNKHEITGIKALGRELGVNRVAIKTAQVYDFEQGHPLIPKEETLSRYKKDTDGKYKLKKRLLNHCWKLWQGAEITWDGRVLPCCFDKDAQFEMGMLSNQDFTSIWKKSQLYYNFRTQLLKGRNYISICKNCTEGTGFFN